MMDGLLLYLLSVKEGHREEETVVHKVLQKHINIALVVHLRKQHLKEEQYLLALVICL